MRALIVDGRVAEVFEEFVEGVPLEQRYHPEFVAQLVPYDPANPPAEPESPAQSLIASVTMRQARLALLAAGKLDAADAAIDAHGPAARIEWDYAATVHRDNPLVQAMAAALDVDLDEMFATAAQL